MSAMMYSAQLGSLAQACARVRAPYSDLNAGNFRNHEKHACSCFTQSVLFPVLESLRCLCAALTFFEVHVYPAPRRSPRVRAERVEPAGKGDASNL